MDKIHTCPCNALMVLAVIAGMHLACKVLFQQFTKFGDLPNLTQRNSGKVKHMHHII